jgi:hypothetical protein
MTNTTDDCYHRALPGEPRFTLLGRDPDFQRLVIKWARRRKRDIDAGDRPQSDQFLVDDALALAKQAPSWRSANMGKWRRKW